MSTADKIKAESQLAQIKNLYREKLGTEIDKVIAIRGGNPQLKAIQELWLKAVPGAKFQHKACAQLAHETKMWARSEHNTSRDKKSGLKHALKMPASLLLWLEAFVPDLLTGNSDERRKKLRNLTKVFPEYKTFRAKQ